MNGNNSAPKFEMLAEFSTNCTGEVLRDRDDRQRPH